MGSRFCRKVCAYYRSGGIHHRSYIYGLSIAGMWDALQGSSENKPAVEERQVESIPARQASAPDQYEDSHHAPSIPMGFGRGRGGRGDFGRGGGRGAGRGRGPERDAKGKDWDCPSCTNTNWSWRSTCNKCNTSKPSSVFVRLQPPCPANRVPRSFSIIIILQLTG